MFKKIKRTALGAITLFAAAVGFSPEAKAYDNDYCREYTRTVYIGGRTQDAYGTACLQPNGDWMIVGEGLNNDVPAYADNVQYVIRDNRRVINPSRVVYYERNYYRTPRVQPTFIWYNDGRYYRDGRYYKYNKKWDRHDYRGNGRGHDHGRGRGHGRD